MPPEVEGAVLEGRTDGARLRMPEGSGPYRLFLYAYDAAGRAATANVPLLVKGQVRTPMPFYVYRDGFEGMPWAPSGWMGSTESLTLDGDHAGNPHEGKACIKMRFDGELGTGSASPGSTPPTTGASRKAAMTSPVRRTSRCGPAGNTVARRSASVSVSSAGQGATRIRRKTRSRTFASAEEWQRYRIRLKKLDLSSIKTGFVVTVAGRSPA